MSITSEKIAEYAAEISYESLSDEAIDRTERVVYDTIGCALGAYTSPPSKALRRCYENQGEAATVIGSGATTATEYAALINSGLARYLDYNDTYVAEGRAIHPSDHILALLAVAEAENATGRDLIEAIALAYEVEAGGRDTGLLFGTGFDYVVWGTTSSAAAVGKLMGLNEDQLCDAMGIAGTSSNGLGISRSGNISMWKGIAHGYVNHNAVQACQMARAGMTGPRELFEGPRGVFDVVTGEPFDIEFGGRDGRHYRVARTNIKPYACGYYIGTAVEGALTLVDENGIDVDKIESVNVRTFENAAQALTGPEKRKQGMTRESADHSIAYTVAAALLDGEVTPRQYDAEHLNSDRVFEMVDRITVEEDSELTAYTKEHGDSIPHVVRIDVGGRSYETKIDYPRGHWRRPMSDEQLDEKVSDMALQLLTADQFQRMRDVCFDIRNLDTVDPLLEHVVV